MTDNTLEDSLLRPVQEEGQQKTPATLEMLADLLHKKILDSFYLGISENFWELIGIVDSFNLAISGNC